MPRSARKVSDSGIYHVMLRGINRQDIFLDDEDHRRFLLHLTKCKKICGFEIYAWCLMKNHVHLVIKTEKVPLGEIFRRLGSRYVYWYNLKYERVGHLFQDRFKSETVEDDSYFMSVIRYVIQNPMKAGLEAKPGSYPWNSYRAYTGEDDGLTDTAAMKELFGSEEMLISYLCAENTERGMEIPDKNPGVTDTRAREIILSVTGKEPGKAFEGLSSAEKRKATRAIIKENVSLRQLARLSGLAVSHVRYLAGKTADENT